MLDMYSLTIGDYLMKHLINTAKALTLSFALGTSVMSMTDGERELITGGTLPYINAVLNNTAACETEVLTTGSSRISRKLARYYDGLCTQLLAIEDRAVLEEQIKGLGEQAFNYRSKLKTRLLKGYNESALYGILAPYSVMMDMVADHLMTIEQSFNDGVAAEALPIDASLFTTQYP